MSNAYSAFTCAPTYLALDAVEREILDRMGCGVEPHAGPEGGFYVYGAAEEVHPIDDGLVPGLELSEEAQIFVRTLQDNPLIDLENDDALVVAAILQRCIRRQGLPCAAVEGALYADKMRPGHWGGFAIFVTPDRFQFMSTSQWIDEKAAELDDSSSAR